MAEIKKFQSPESSPGLQVSGEKKIWVNSTFLGAANCDSVKVVEKSVKSEAKSPETLRLHISGWGRPNQKISKPGLQLSGKNKTKYRPLRQSG